MKLTEQLVFFRGSLKYEVQCTVTVSVTASLKCHIPFQIFNSLLAKHGIFDLIVSLM